MNSRSDARRVPPATEAERKTAAPPSASEPDAHSANPIVSPRWVPWIFAAKTTASGLLALLIAFTFNLDQPKWALLTVFIVAQPQSGLVLAKSFYRIIGTVVGAGVALLLVALFAQERVLFLGTLAIWIGLCTFASKQARNFTAYGFVLSGYTAAIVGIPGALDPGNAFFTAVARVTEVSLGIMTTAAISHLVLPVSLAGTLRRAVATSRAEIADYAARLLSGRDTNLIRTKLLGEIIKIENLRASAVFEDRDIRDRAGSLRRLDVAMLGVIDIAHLLGRSLESLQRVGAVMVPGLAAALTEVAAAIGLWSGSKLDTADLRRRLVRASAGLPRARELYREPSMSNDGVIEMASVIGRVREFCAAFLAVADAHEIFASRDPRAMRPPRFSLSNDRIGALWAGVRAAMALVLVSAFWILADWPNGVTGATLAAVATARLATMEHATKAATGGALLFVLATIPAFILVEVLLPDAEGFAMFALAVAPVLFCCAYLMGHEKTAGLGFIAGLYFAAVSGFQDRMAYDPVGFLNTSIALVIAAATAAVLFAIVAPDTPQAARRRFGRAVRRAFERIFGRSPIGLTEFETTVTEALDQLRGGLKSDQGDDVAAIDAGIALLGAGRELIRVRDDGGPAPSATVVEGNVVRLVVSNERLVLDRAQSVAQDAAARCLAELRDDRLGAADAQAAAREMVAFAAIRDELARGGELLIDETRTGASTHVA